MEKKNNDIKFFSEEQGQEIQGYVNRLEKSNKEMEELLEKLKQEEVEKEIQERIEEPIKRKRGRPRKTEQQIVIEQQEEQRQREQEEQALKAMSRAFGNLAVIPLEILVRLIDKEATLYENEKQDFIQATELLVEKYSIWVKTYSVEVNFLLVLGSIIGMKMYEKYQREKQKEKQNENSQIQN